MVKNALVESAWYVNSLLKAFEKSESRAGLLGYEVAMSAFNLRLTYHFESDGGYGFEWTDEDGNIIYFEDHYTNEPGEFDLLNYGF